MILTWISSGSACGRCVEWSKQMVHWCQLVDWITPLYLGTTCRVFLVDFTFERFRPLLGTGSSIWVGNIHQPTHHVRAVVVMLRSLLQNYWWVKTLFWALVQTPTCVWGTNQLGSCFHRLRWSLLLQGETMRAVLRPRVVSHCILDQCI